MKARFLLHSTFTPVTGYDGISAIRENLLANGFLVVKDENTFKGILTPENIVQAPHNLVIDCVRDRPVVDYDQGIDDILGIMESQGFNVLPVFKRGEFAGVIQQSDIIEYFKDYTCDLEEKVKQQTAELKATNERLSQEIADRQRLEEKNIKLVLKNQQAHKLQSIGNLAGGIAHDFNNILSSIIGYTELTLCEVDRGSEVEENLQEIYKAGKRARDLVKQILTFARRTGEDVRPVRIDQVVKEALALLRSTIPANIDIQQDINSAAWINGNPALLEQVVVNLATNAVDAMEVCGGTLSVALCDVDVDEALANDQDLARSGAFVRVTVSDNGVGIAPDVIQSIFDPYFTTKATGKGTGMGLAIVHGTVKKYGGSIAVDSQPGRGTAFTVLLPATSPAATSQDRVPETLPRGDERILFVDDEPSIAKMGGQLLNRLGYTVIASTRSGEALALFQARPGDFDLVITDMTMPGMTGDQLAIEVIKIRKDIPVILCTGYNRRISDSIAKEIGINALIYKPMVMADLAHTIRNVLDAAKNAANP